MTERNVADVNQPITAARAGLPPLALRVIIERPGAYTASGPMMSTRSAETYVLLSALPQELQERVRTAVQAMLSGV